MAEIKDPRGKHLLGEAVRLLVQSGVTGAAITDFINDYSEVVSTTLAAPPAGAVDLKDQVKEALKEALQELVPQPKRARSAAGTRKQVAVLVNGARTSLYLPKALVEATATSVGGEKARQLIEELANTAPKSEKNRSAWVEAQLQQQLLLVKAESNLSGKLAH